MMFKNFKKMQQSYMYYYMPTESYSDSATVVAYKKFIKDIVQTFNPNASQTDVDGIFNLEKEFVMVLL